MVGRETGRQGNRETRPLAFSLSFPVYLSICLPVYLCTLLAFALRALWLDRQSLWSDELITLNRTALPPQAILTWLPIEQMPLYFLLQSGWTRLAGDSDFALRFPSAIWGTLAVALLYALGRRLFGRRVALLGTALFAINPFQVWYGQDARMYTQVAALSVATWLTLDMALPPRTQPPAGSEPAGGYPRTSLLPWLAYILAATLALYTHYYAALALVIAGVYAAGRIAQSADRGRLWRAFVAAELGIALLLIPWLPRVLRFLDFPGWREPVTYTLPDLVSAYTFGATLPTEYVNALSGLALLLYGVGLVSLAMRDSSPAAQSDKGRLRRVSPAFILTLAALAVPALVILALLWVKPDFHPRYFIAATPVYSLLLAQGILAGRRWTLWSAATLAVVLVVSSLSLRLWYTDPNYAKAYYKNYLEYILAQAGPHDALLLQGPSQQLARRYGSDRLDEVVNLQSSRLRDRPAAEVVQMVADMTRDHPTLWLATEVPIPAGPVKVWLDQHGYQATPKGFGPIDVWAYHFPAPLSPPNVGGAGSGPLTPPNVGGPGGQPPAQVSGPAAVEIAWTTPATSAHAGDTVPIEVRWTPTAPQPPDLKVSLRLLAADGRVVWQRDRAPQDGSRPSADWTPGEPVPDRYAVRLPHDLPPGRYAWQAVLYDGRTLAEQRVATLGPLQVGE